MARSIKRPRLTAGYDGPRRGPRDVVSLNATCQVGEGEPFAVGLLDLDTHGCRVSGFTAAVTKADAIHLTIGEIGPVETRIRWAKRGGAGLRFEEPLDDAALAEAQETASSLPEARVVPLRRPLAEDQD